MSCNSPWKVAVGASVTEYSKVMTHKVKGKTTIPGYTTPDFDITLPLYVPGYIIWGKCCSGGLRTDCYNKRYRKGVYIWTCDTSWDDCRYQLDCQTGWVDAHTDYNTVHFPGIQLWPSLELSAGSQFNVEYITSEELEISQNGIAVTTLLSLQISEISIEFYFGDEKIDIEIPTDIKISENGGQIYSKVSLFTLANHEFKKTIAGTEITFSMTLIFYILFCLNPEEPMTFVNLEIDFSLKGSFERKGKTITFENLTASIACPLIPPE